ncbi:MAG TPA: hypothetical protein VFB07_00075 [Vicinamibacterales bacterium]|nr:hypothetical protein [Vicinamibacterales bacterium]
MADSIQAHAADNLRYIRDAMSRASEFTAVPGWGGVAMGASAVAAAAISGPPDGTVRWVAVWLADAAVAATIGFVTTVRKANRVGTPLFSTAAAHRFALAYLPPLVAGMILTPVFVTLDLMARLPGCWLLLYGTALASGGANAVRIVPLTGVAFMALSLVAFAAPAAWGHWMLAAGFGGLHIGFGLVIARKHGG